MSDTFNLFKEVPEELKLAEAELRAKSIQYFSTGSYVIGVENSDFDIVILSKDFIIDTLASLGYETSNPDDPDRPGYNNSSLASCWRKGNVNIIVTRTLWDFNNWKHATMLMHGMNLQEKHQRVALVQFLTEGHVRGTVVINPLFRRPDNDTAQGI